VKSNRVEENVRGGEGRERKGRQRKNRDFHVGGTGGKQSKSQQAMTLGFFAVCEVGGNMENFLVGEEFLASLFLGNSLLPLPMLGSSSYS
jgi:hypothetical protein